MLKYWVAFSTITTREIRRFLRVWGQSLLPSAITMSLYFVIFGGLIGERVGKIGAVDYALYITPGLVMMSVITNSYTNVSTSFYLMRFQRSLEEILISPVPNYVLLLGFVAGGVARGLLIGCIVIGVSLFFTHLHIQHIFLMLFVVLLTATLFSLAGFINGVYANKFDDISLVPTFILTPLTYLGGVFYSVNMLPPFWEHVSRINPILYMVNTFRFGMLGFSDVDVLNSFLLLIGLVGFLYWYAINLLKRGVGIRT